MAQVTPLLDVFLALREEQFPLGVDDFLEITDLVRCGLVPSSRADVVSACQTLWAKSPEEAVIIAAFLERHLPSVFTVEDFESLEQQAAEERQPRPPDAGGQSEQGVPKPARRGPPPPRAASARRSPTAAQVRDYRYGTVDPAHAIRLPSGRKLEIDPNIDLRGRFPVSQRQMKRAWRRLRRMLRVGPPVELDMEATLEQIHRSGVVEHLVFVPRRTNTARLVILRDVDGSMAPFCREMDALVDSARLAGLRRLDVAYFHDVPGGVVYRDAEQKEPVTLDKALEPFSEAGILVVGDAGAARGRLEQGRVAKTIAALRHIRGYSPNVAWLNPVPRHRWPGSTAGAVAEASPVPMFPFDRLGLTEAVDTLRGITAA